MTRSARCLSFLLLVLACVGAQAWAGGRESLDGFTRGLKSLEGKFSQDVYDSKGQRKERSSGWFALAAPKQFRWEYVAPHPQSIIADGKVVWVYDPDLKQATRRPQGVEEENSPLAALVDPKRLDRDYIVKDGGSQGGLVWLELRPKAENAGFERALLGFSGQTLQRMQIFDAIGQRTEIQFSAFKRNPALPAKTFRFAPPKGVDVIGAG